MSFVSCLIEPHQGDLNLITGNVQNGVLIASSDIMTVKGNIIGTDITGLAQIGNGTDGMLITESSHGTIGGSTAAERNIISRNGGNGIEIYNNLSHSSDQFTISGNYIGVGIDGTTDLGNTLNGIKTHASTNLIIGGATLAERNLVIGNDGAGMDIDASSAVEINRNVISGNNGAGIQLRESNNITVINNFVGVDATGNVRLGNGAGISLVDTNDSLIGKPNEGNVIVLGATPNVGIMLQTSQNNTVKSNLIGITPNGTILSAPTLSGGIVMMSGQNNLFGGTNVGDGNTITGFDVGIVAVSGTSNEFRQNSTYANRQLGIDLSDTSFTLGVTLNDANDADSGPNDNLNFPVFQSITTSGGNLTIKGCAPAGAAIELFKTDISMGTAAVGDNKVGKTQDYGEGQKYLTTLIEGSGADADSGTGCPVDADGNNQSGMNRFSFTIPIPTGVVSSDLLTATATVTGTGTSEFSAVYAVGAGMPEVQLVKSCPSPANCTTTAQNPGTDLTYKIAFESKGTIGAQNVVIVDRIPNNTDFKLGSAAANLGTTGLTVVVEYSSDFDPLNPTAATWTYTPTSAGGGASAGYDRNVKAIRWRVTAGTLSNIAPDNVGDVSFVTKIQ